MDRGWRLARTLVFALLAFHSHVALPPPTPLSSAAAVAVFMLLRREFELNPCAEERRRTTRTMIWGVRVGRRWAAAEKEKSILLKKSLHSNSNINQFPALGCGGKRVGAEGSAWGRWIEGAGAAVEGEGPSERRANFFSPSYPYRNERPDVYTERYQYRPLLFLDR
uniref:Uncharacterized protein n=1 Tax=Oryza meridionalis TaxID=40149 RepID=A0A0E0CEA6_9ORYZ